MPNSSRYKKGAVIPAASLNKNARLQTTKVVGGKGIRVSGQGQEIVISQTGVARGGGTTMRVQTVLALPAIPTTGMKEVFWTSAGEGTGDDQVWRAYAGQTRWYPTQKWTSLSGTP